MRPSPLHAIAGSSAARLALYALLALAAVWALLPSAGALNEYRDAQVLAIHQHAAVDAVRRFGELPLWNPWYCGGLYGLGAPQSRFASPLLLVDLLVGPERAEPIVVFFLLVAGMEGTYRWLALRTGERVAALPVAPIFALSGHFAVATFRGWTNFFGFELVPFVLYGVALAARGRARGIAVAAVAFALLLGFGGTFAAPLVAVAAAVEAARGLSEVAPSRRREAVVTVAACALLVVLAAAFRLWPIAETLAAAPRVMAGTPGKAPAAIFASLVRALSFDGGEVGDEGAFFVGGAFLALAALGGADRRSFRALVVIVLFVWLSAGYARRPALFGLLRELPVFSALRYPERFLWIAILFACEPATYALARVPFLGDGRAYRRGAVVVLGLLVAYTIAAELRTFSAAAGARHLGVLDAPRGEPFRQARGNRWLAAHYASLGVGSLSCWEAHPVVMSSRLRGDLAAEEYLEDPSAGIARRVSWSPHAPVVHVELEEPGRLLVNQNWHPGWRASVGEVTSADGLLAVDLPAGAYDVALAFRPRSALAGAAVSAAALAAALALALRRRGYRAFAGRRPLAALVALAPLAVGGAFVATWDEPRYPPPEARNADGSPALVDAAPEPRLDVLLPPGVRLEAARVDPPDELDNVSVTLYLRRVARIPRATTAVVRLVRRPAPLPPPDPTKPRPTAVLRADHQVVGGTFYVSEAPEGALVRDAFAINVARAVSGEYDVLVGFGDVLDCGEPADATTRVGSFVIP